MITSSTSSFRIRDLFTASSITHPPKSVALKGLNAPRKLPMAVRTALVITTSLIDALSFLGDILTI
jgi:hypothetical protein